MDEQGATLQIGEKSLELPAVPAHQGNSGIDISKLRASEGIVTYDPGFANTASAQSTITYIDPTAGKLTHRGYPIEELANSIAADGLIQPITVRPLPSDGAAPAYQIVAGERRWRAAQASGRETIPVVVADVADAELLELARPIEEYFGTVNISDAQVEYFRQVLADNADARWTFVLMHSPAWWTASGFPQDPRNFAKIEHLLADRPYTVFAAHTHLYNYTERNGRDYITAAMTGAMNISRLGAIDHLIWVTMTKNGPKIANLLLNGILDKHGPVEGDHTIEFGMYRPPAAQVSD